jgi:hypothetical protein
MNYKIRCVVMRTMSFHVKKKEQNGVVLSDIIPPSSSPGRAKGKIEICVSHLFLPRVHTPPHNEKPTKPSLQTTPIGHLIRRRGRAGRPLSLCIVIGWR